MTYYDTVIKDTPIGLWMLDGNMTDATGRGATATLTGTRVDTAALVDGPTKSFRSNPSLATVTVPFSLGQDSTSGQPFSIECWFYTRNTNSKVLGHTGTNTDGIYINSAGEIQFSLRLTTGTVSVSWKPPFGGRRHVVGVYTGNSIELYVDGDTRAKYEFTEAEKEATIELTEASNNLGHATGITLQAIATYNYVLPLQAIRRHWRAGNRSAGSEIASQLYTGKRIELSTRTSNLLAQKFWDSENWQMGFSNATIGEELSSAVDDTGAYVDSYWTDSFELEGSDAIDGVQLEWEGQGTFTVETSVDGVIWATIANGGRVSQITEGFITANKILSIRISFTAGAYGEVSYINATGFKDRTVKSPEFIPVVRPAGSKIYTPKEMNLRDDRSGIEFTGTLSVGPNSEVGALPVKSLGFWYWLPPSGGGFSSISFSAAALYENGAILSPITTKVGHWNYLVYTHPTGQSAAINFVGTNLKIAHISLWENELTAAEVATIYKSFVGFSTIKSSSVDSMGVITEPEALIYADNWSISKAGV